MLPPPPTSTLFPYTTLFRSSRRAWQLCISARAMALCSKLPVNLSRQCVSSAEAEAFTPRSEEHMSELQSRPHLVCRLLLEKKKKKKKQYQKQKIKIIYTTKH